MIENIVLKIILSYNTRLIVISFVSQNRQQLRFINRMVCIISTMEGKELFVEIVCGGGAFSFVGVMSCCFDCQ